MAFLSVGRSAYLVLAFTETLEALGALGYVWNWVVKYET